MGYRNAVFIITIFAISAFPESVIGDGKRKIPVVHVVKYADPNVASRSMADNGKLRFM